MSNIPALPDILDELGNAEELACEASSSSEFTDEQKEEISAYITEIVSSQLKPKIDRYAQSRIMRKAKVEAIRKEAERLLARANAEENNQAWMDKVYLEAMEKHGKPKLSGETYTISVRHTKELAIVSGTIKAEDLPDDLCNIKTVRTISKTKILNALKSGEVINGCMIGRTKFIGVN